MIDWTDARFEKLPCGAVLITLPDESIWFVEFLTDDELRELAQTMHTALGEVAEFVKIEAQKRGLLCVVL